MPAIHRFYTGLDACVGRLLGAVPEDTLVLLMSDHGFGPFHKYFHVNNWLHQIGLLQFRRTPLSLFKRLLFRLGLTPVTAIKLAGAFNLNMLRKKVKRGRGRNLIRRWFLSMDDVDWQRTPAFSIGNFGQIYINVRGERPQGIVEPGAEYEAVRQQIIDAALALRDPENGDRVIAAAYRREDLYRGARLPHAPDLILHTDRAKYVSFGHADFGSNRLVEPSVGQTGHHTMDGILIVHGHDIRLGAVLTKANIMDVAPTILFAAGLPVPANMDGRPLTEAFEPEYVAAHPIRRGPALVHENHQQDYSAKDQEQITDRLRDLGYVA